MCQYVNVLMYKFFTETKKSFSHYPTVFINSVTFCKFVVSYIGIDSFSH